MVGSVKRKTDSECEILFSLSTHFIQNRTYIEVLDSIILSERVQKNKKWQ